MSEAYLLNTKGGTSGFDNLFFDVIKDEKLR